MLATGAKRTGLELVMVAGLAAISAPFALASEAEVDVARIKAISIMADKTPSVKAELAADCRFAYTLMGDLARNPYTDVHGQNDYAYAKSTDFMADVWGLVLYREAKLQKKDPMTVKGKFIKKTMRLGLVSRERLKSGSLKPIEKQAKKCRKAMRASESANETLKQGL